MKNFPKVCLKNVQFIVYQLYLDKKILRRHGGLPWGILQNIIIYDLVLCVKDSLSSNHVPSMALKNQLGEDSLTHRPLVGLECFPRATLLKAQGF